MDAILERLKKLLALEREEENRRFIADAKDIPLAIRRDQGQVLYPLSWSDEDVGLGGRWLLRLGYDGPGQIPESYRPGTPVRLVVHGAEDGAEQEDPHADAGVWPLKSTVYRRYPQSLIIAAEVLPATKHRFSLLRLELSASDITYQRSLKALDGVAQDAAGKRGEFWRRFWRGEKEGSQGAKAFESPTVAPPALAASVPEDLNAMQQEAFWGCVSAEHLFLIHGPPGTGKSHVLGALAKHYAGPKSGDNQSQQRVLLCAASNAAVDHLVELCIELGLSPLRIGHPARVDEALHGHCLDVLVEESEGRKVARELFDDAYELLGYARRQRRQGRSKERFANARDAKKEARELLARAKRLEKQAIDHVLGQHQIIAATLTALGSSLLREHHFDVALFDEATQANAAMGLWPFLAADRVFLAGDHHQLPPTVLSMKAAPELGRSVFERLVQAHPKASVMLETQYRMHGQIMGFVSEETYAGKLIADGSVVTRGLVQAHGHGDFQHAPLVYMDTAGSGFSECQKSESTSFSNPGEVELLLLHLQHLLAEAKINTQAALQPADIGIITPYNAQVQTLRQRLQEVLGDVADDIETASVDAFQGREKEVILVTLVRSNNNGDVGFLRDIRRMNVAFSRARRQLFVVGDSATLAASEYFEHFMTYTQHHGAYHSIWEWQEAATLMG